jgi:Tfp pilus assembly protein PilF
MNRDAIPETLRQAAELFDSGSFERVSVMCAEIDPTGRFGAQAANLSGMARFMLGEHQAAASDFEEALRRRPDFVMPHLGLGNVAKELGDLHDAQSHYEKVLAAGHNIAAVHSGLGDVYERRGEFGHAVEQFSAALDQAPGDPVGRFKLGNALMLQGRCEDAMPHLTGAVEADPGFIKAYSNLQACGLKLGRVEDVLEACVRCRAQDPDNQFSIAHQAFALMATGDESGFDSLYPLDRFPHPIEIGPVPGFDDIAALNAQLYQDILSHPSLSWHHADAHRTTPRGFAYGILTQPTPAITAFATEVRRQIQAFMDAMEPVPGHPLLGARPQRFELEMWATVLNSGGEHPEHSHEDAWLSGVYYCSTGFMQDDPNDSRAGWIRFAGFDEYTDDPRFLSKVRIEQPREGQMFLFPSYFLHQTIPFNVDGYRISIAFDVQPR